MGLGPDWTCLFANDISAKKAKAYRANFEPASELLVADIHQVTTHHIPGTALLAWASFPCQDLSLAGNGGGLGAKRSGTIWPFWLLMTELEKEGRGTPIIVLENVVGMLSSNKGQDFQDLLMVLVKSGYRVGALVVDAVHFVPQSRQRLFIIAVKKSYPIPEHIMGSPIEGSVWHPNNLMRSYNSLSQPIKEAWVWWDMPLPSIGRKELHEIVEENPQDVDWHTKEEIERILSMMSPGNLLKVANAQKSGRVEIGTVYKRIREENGEKFQRAEVRFDGVSGCLRTPVGGSSRQILIVVKGDQVRSRLLSVREAARLMGLEDTYILPKSYNDGYHVMGDAVAVPVVSWLEKSILRPLAVEILKSELVET